MAVDWGMAVIDPTKQFKFGSDYVNQLYDTQAAKQAGGAIANGDPATAARDLGSRGDIASAQKLTGQANEMAAGAQYASGDYGGAASTLAKSGNIAGAQSVADKQAEIFQRQHAYIAQAVPILTQIYQKAGPQALGQAFDQITPELQAIGTDPAQIARLRQGFQSNPEQTLQVLQATAAKNWDIQKTEDGTVLGIDKNNPSAPPAIIYQGGMKAPEVKNVIQGSQEQSLQWDQKKQQWVPIGTPGPRFNPATEIRIQQQAGDPSQVEPIAQMVAGYKMPLPSGFALRSPFWQSVLARAHEINPKFDAKTYQQEQRGVIAFASGKQGDQTRSLGVAVQHLGVLSDLSDALQNGDIQAVNRLSNAYSQQTGAPAPQSFNLVKQFVSSEVLKAAAGGALNGADRDALQSQISSASSPRQLKDAIRQAKLLLGGQLNGLEKQYQNATGKDDFEALLPEGVYDQLHNAGSSGGGTPGKTGNPLVDKWLIK